MNHQKKTVLFIFCVLIFLILAPLVIFYGLGYQYDFKEKEVIRTGAVIIKTIPPRANIFLDGELQNKNNFWEELLNDFVKINQLKVGKYNLRIEKNGCHSWEKNIEIKEGMVVKIDSVILLPANPKIKTAITCDINNFWFSGDKSRIVYTVFGDQKNIVLKALELNKSPENISEFKLLALKTNSEINNLEWSENNKNIIFETVTDKNLKTEISKFYLINLEEKKIVNLNKDFGLVINKRWQAKSGDIFYLKNNDLYRINYFSQSINLFLKNVVAYAVKNNFIYYVKSMSINSENSKTAVYKIKNNGLSDESLIAELPLENNFSKIRISAGDQIILKSKEGNLYLIENDSNKNPNFINSSVADFKLSEEKDRFFYFNDYEIWVYYLKEKTGQSAKEKNDNELITRFSGEIKAVVWHSDFEHLFFKVGETIKFVELDSRDKKNCFNFIELNNSTIPLFGKEKLEVVENQNNSLIFDPEKNKLYFLDKADERNVLKEILLFSS